MKHRAAVLWLVAIMLAATAVVGVRRCNAPAPPPTHMAGTTWLDQSFAPLPITTTSQYTQPAVNATVSVAFDSTVNLATGVTVYIVGGGYYSVASIADNTHAVLTNLGSAGNATSTAVIAGGAHASLTGPSGAAATLTVGSSGQYLRWDGGADGGPAWQAKDPAGTSDAGARRPSATGSGSFFFLTDAPIGYFDDPVSASWKQFPFPLFTGAAPLASAYTVFGSLALSQVADAVSAVTTTNGVSANLALVAGSLGSSATWVVTLEIEFMPGWGQQYPSFAVVVADNSSDYGMLCASNGGGADYICHQEKDTINGSKISNGADLLTTQHYGGTAGVMFARILADGVNAHYQLSNNGVRWSSVTVAATPTGLTNYGFLLGSPLLGSTSFAQAWVLENSLKPLALPQVSVSGATNATPIVITTSTPHGLASGDLVAIHGVLGNTTANTGTGNNALGGAALVNVLSPTTFQLVGVAGTGAYTSGGTVTLVSR